MPGRAAGGRRVDATRGAPGRRYRPVPTVHGLALYDQPALPADFAHFPYVNPEAPPGGELVRAAQGSFDSTNPFIIKGTPASGLNAIYDTLMVSNPDEPFSMYGLLAEGVRLDPERRWMEFDINPRRPLS